MGPKFAFDGKTDGFFLPDAIDRRADSGIEQRIGNLGLVIGDEARIDDRREMFQEGVFNVRGDGTELDVDV